MGNSVRKVPTIFQLNIIEKGFKFTNHKLAFNWGLKYMFTEMFRMDFSKN